MRRIMPPNMRPTSTRCLAPLLAILLLTQGCGIKGPLYIPTAEQKQQAEERRQRREAAMQRESGQAQAVRPEPAIPPAQPDAASAARSPEDADESLENSTPQMPEETFGSSSLPL